MRIDRYNVGVVRLGYPTLDGEPQNLQGDVVSEPKVRRRLDRPHPRLNGKVERSHRIDSEEFYRLLQGQVIDDTNLFAEKLQEWEDYYNYHPPAHAEWVLPVRLSGMP